jgi:acyl carrier protein
MSAPETTIASLRKIIAREFELDPQLLRADARLEDLAIDSLGVIEIMFAVEEEFGITVPPELPQTQTSINTLDDLVRYVDRLVGEQHDANRQHEGPA